jgi:UDP-N-acetylglucosamine 2-epimerase
MRKIAVITGTRAEYGILRSVLKAIDSAEDLLVLMITDRSKGRERCQEK